MSSRFENKPLLSSSQTTGFLRNVFENLFRTQSLRVRDGTLKKCLSVLDLLAYGLSSTIGSGIYVSTGIAAHGDLKQGVQGAGPAVIISFVLAGFASLLSAFCYAEFATRVPVSGSAYTFSYVSLGEIVAWIIGWCITLEYAISASAIARSWSSTFMRLVWPSGDGPLWLDGYEPVEDGIISFSLLSVVVIIVCSVIMISGVKQSAKFTVCITAWNILIILFIIVVGSFQVDTRNWRPFAPNGFQGIITGAGTVFFSYIGFDCVTSLAAEVKKPQNDMPVAIIGTLSIASFLYIGTALVLTGMVNWTKLDIYAPLSVAFLQVTPAIKWASTLVAVGSLTTLSATTLTSLMGQPRIFYRMAKDGLLPPAFLRVSSRHIPIFSAITTTIMSALLAAFFDIDLLADLISIGTLFAFSVVCSGLLVVRYTPPKGTEPHRWGVFELIEPLSARAAQYSLYLIVFWWVGCIALALVVRFYETVHVGYIAIPCFFLAMPILLLCTVKSSINEPESFKCPLVPVVPLCGILVNIILILQKSWLGLAYFAVWFFIGMIIYFAYGYSNSNLAKPKPKSPEERNVSVSLEDPSFESTDDDPFAYDVLVLSPSKTDVPAYYRNTEFSEKDLM
eukprot:TRINITY_DN3108_c0_g1_i1.p1 TRINITY_DN3108_c0_g1~~TRINITY_DN3108_c0_g1_i1.p1  ORF type:complete len:620 (+),score=49.40 TRINITY_DN3108_c0_g1_i1:325-2184(+)